MAILKNIVYLSAAEYNTLATNGTITKGGVTLTYDPDANVYVVPAPAPVTGTNDGTNWTSLTIGGVTKAIPQGGGGGGGETLKYRTIYRGNEKYYFLDNANLSKAVIFYNVSYSSSYPDVGAYISLYFTGYYGYNFATNFSIKDIPGVSEGDTVRLVFEIDTTNGIATIKCRALTVETEDYFDYGTVLLSKDFYYDEYLSHDIGKIKSIQIESLYYNAPSSPLAIIGA